MKKFTFEDALKDCPKNWINVDAQKTIDGLLWSTITQLDLLTSDGTVYDELHHMTRKKAIRQCKEFLTKYKDYAKDDTVKAMAEYI